MHPLLLSLADGTAFFVGLLLVIAAEVSLFAFGNRIARSILTIIAVLGILLVIISATPLAIWAYAIWITAAVLGLVLLNFSEPSWKRCRLCVGALLFVTVIIGLLEIAQHRMPNLAVKEGATVYVLGDSISAGVGANERPWPAVLDGMIDQRVINLAKPGATTASARTQLKGIADPGSLVIIEIGGNDMIGGTAGSVFRTNLNELLSTLRADQHEVLLLELPLLPFRNAYGKAQRDAAREHGAVMLPKRFFTRVLGTPNGTIDGLHLSETGHQAMADVIADVLKGQ